MVHHKNTNKLFSDLGKPTRRGVRKCYKCGEINGTRGYSCKNKQCDVVFKEYADKTKVNLEAVKLTGTSKQVYSVRVRDKGPDHRGFVQLPFIPSTDTYVNLISDNAICFVNSCQRLFDDSILRCHETELSNVSSLCVHAESALQSDVIATQINLKESTLNLIKIPSEVKRKLWDLITASQGAVIQRVSKHVMVVKCQVSAKHPLGYLHFTFGKSKGKDVFDKYLCSCFDIKFQNNDEYNQKCIHYYACVCSFASNSRLTEEFMNFINLEFEIGFTRIHFKNIRAQNDNALDNEEKTKLIQSKMRVKKLKHASNKKNALALLQKAKQLTYNKKNPILSQTHADLNINFHNWLVAVIELINSRLQCNRNAESVDSSLVFFISESFFDLLRDKINLHSQQNKPIFTEQYFLKKDSTHIILTRYVWHINLREVAAIFSTPQISLEVIKKTINVGLLENDKEAKPCIIEWTPNILEISKFGELKLKFTITP